MRLIRIFRSSPKPVVSKSKVPITRSYLFCGHTYKSHLSAAGRNSLKVVDGEFRITLRQWSQEAMDEYVGGWYRRQCRAAFGRAVQRWRPALHDLGYEVPEPRLKIYVMRRAWGRCYYTKQMITINLNLLKCPVECFDYIVLHELCHFVHQNHSKDFHDLMTTVDPTWKEHDQTLKTFIRAEATILQRLHK